MPGEKREQEISVLGRLCSLEMLLLVMGLVSLIYGILVQDWWRAALGALILAACLVVWRLWKRWISNGIGTGR